MAKRGKSGYSSTADDDPGYDDPNTPDPRADVVGPAYPEGKGSGGTREVDERPGNYEVVDPGTIIDGIYYPKTDCPAGQEMRAYLDDAQAQALANGGVKLKNVETGEELAPVKEEKPEPEIDEPLNDEASA